VKERGITLIGMPGSGKSTIGRDVSAIIHYSFLDIDEWMIKKEGASIRHIIDTKGTSYLLSLEAKAIYDNELFEKVISPPGSIIYTDTFEKIKKQTRVIWLKNSYDTIVERLAQDPKNARGVIGLENHGLKKIYNERTPMYETWADHIIKADNKTVEEIISEVLEYIY
jgi:shikimate kinase